ncbi:MAG: hypothetical protein H7144_09435 [Burkholderiales bacterium]|nr:hypothetical protein [Phycisphaerae bacterium]
MNLAFVHTHAFVADWSRLRLADEELRQLELLILERPDSGTVMRGTGGVRKVRFASHRTAKARAAGVA